MRKWVWLLILSVLLLGCGAPVEGQLVVGFPTPLVSTGNPVAFSASMSGAKQMQVVLDGSTIYQQKVQTLSFAMNVAVGNHTVQFRAQQSRGGWVQQTVMFAVVPPLTATPLSLPSATCVADYSGGWVNPAYSVQLQVTGGTPPYTWYNAVGLPPGLTQSSSGLVSGVIDCYAIFGPSVAGQRRAVQILLARK